MSAEKVRANRHRCLFHGGSSSASPGFVFQRRCEMLCDCRRLQTRISSVNCGCMSAPRFREECRYASYPVADPMFCVWIPGAALWWSRSRRTFIPCRQRVCLGACVWPGEQLQSLRVGFDIQLLSSCACRKIILYRRIGRILR